MHFRTTNRLGEHGEEDVLQLLVQTPKPLRCRGTVEDRMLVLDVQPLREQRDRDDHHFEVKTHLEVLDRVLPSGIRSLIFHAAGEELRLDRDTYSAWRNAYQLPEMGMTADINELADDDDSPWVVTILPPPGDAIQLIGLPIDD